MVSSLFIRVMKSRQDPVLTERTTWREVGWIFRDGETIAIERCGPSSRVRYAQI